MILTARNLDGRNAKKEWSRVKNVTESSLPPMMLSFGYREPVFHYCKSGGKINDTVWVKFYFIYTYAAQAPKTNENREKNNNTQHIRRLNVTVARQVISFTVKTCSSGGMN